MIVAFVILAFGIAVAWWMWKRQTEGHPYPELRNYSMRPAKFWEHMADMERAFLGFYTGVGSRGVK